MRRAILALASAGALALVVLGGATGASASVASPATTGPTGFANAVPSALANPQSFTCDAGGLADIIQNDSGGAMYEESNGNIATTATGEPLYWCSLEGGS